MTNKDANKIIQGLTEEDFKKFNQEFYNIREEDRNNMLNTFGAFLMAIHESKNIEDFGEDAMILLFILEKINIIKINDNIFIK